MTIRRGSLSEKQVYRLRMFLAGTSDRPWPGMTRKTALRMLAAHGGGLRQDQYWKDLKKSEPI